MDKTLLIIKNSYMSSVKVYLVLQGDPDYFVTNIRDIPFVTNFIYKDSGFFVLESGGYVSFVNQRNKGLKTYISFGELPKEEPTDEYPNGINFVNVTLNNHLEGFCSTEKLSINCVNGVNSLIKISTISGGDWSVDSKQESVTNIRNKELGDNVGCIGVYPYGCDMCTTILKPTNKTFSPIKAPKNVKTQKDSICEIQRSTTKNGGIVLVEFQEYAKNIKDKIISKPIENDEHIDKYVDELCCWKFC